MARISLKDAERLGIVVAGPQAAAARPRKPVPGSKPQGVRRAHKAGRHPVVAPAEDFRIVVSAPLEPVTKHRARTQVDMRAIVAAFIEARGNIERFKLLLANVRHRSFTPENTRAFETVVAQLGAAAMRSRAPVTVPLRLVIVFVMTGDPMTWPTDVTDPDLDNAEKAALDALNGVVWKDDRQIVRKESIKRCGPTPLVKLIITPATPPEDLD